MTEPAVWAPRPDRVELEVEGGERELDGADGGAFGVRQALQVNARVAGPRLGSEVQIAIRARKSGDWSIGADGTVTAG